MKLQKKQSLAQKRRWRIRKKVQGTAERPRLAVHFSNKHIYAQCIDDVKGHTLAYVTSVGGKDTDLKANSEGANALGKAIAEKAKTAGIESVVFDRAGRRYHGCVKSFAEAAREGGLQF
ncbi:50S ribosomal protein L18 [Coraliomargarita sinensis]|uniref:Large ribosomal subunit protein uL18 n=1 Tax=Coraliomargarita sinensis TaxID=2174842 RepID=A0A317ZL72_9BACT|nr:50S ribosomal protein L18 [Coraliomargarita sinensis]PXA04963.1 50S ribosomal protein L18 [Coraliomargarita sinensis]